MIRFTCGHCGNAVRVADLYAGKKGRCPSCKGLVSIPTKSEPETQTEGLDGLAAALGAEATAGEPAPKAPPPPPHTVADQHAELEPELIAAGDPRSKTDRLEAVRDDGTLKLAEEDKPPAPARPGVPPPLARPAPARKKTPNLVVVLAEVLIAVVVAAGIFWFLYWRFQRSAGSAPQEQVAAGPSTSAPVGGSPPTSQPTQVPVAPPASPAKTFDLSDAVLAGTARAQFPAVFLLHLEIEPAAKALAGMSTNDEFVAALGAGKCWKDAPAKVASGALPASVTLLLSGNVAAPDKMLGKFLAPGGDGPLGLWPMTGAASQPHFLLRVTGKAGQRWSRAVAEQARQLGLEAEFPPDKVGTHAMLVLVPPGVAGVAEPDEALLGTYETLQKSGAGRGDPQQVKLLRELLKKVDTSRPMVGFIHPAARAKLAEAVGAPAVGPPPWAQNQTALVFSIGGDKGTLVIAKAGANAARQLEPVIAPMLQKPEGDDIRIDGRGDQALGVLGKLLPELRQGATRALALAEKLAEQTATAPANPPPVVETTRPTPPTKPVGPVVQVDVICFNKTCPTRGQVFKVPSDRIPADVMRGSEPLLCPHCKKATAVVAVKCPKCGKSYAQTYGECPFCGAKK